MLIRTAELSDLPALLAIYNDEVKKGVATFDTEPRRWRSAGHGLTPTTSKTIRF